MNIRDAALCFQSQLALNTFSQVVQACYYFSCPKDSLTFSWQSPCFNQLHLILKFVALSLLTIFASFRRLKSFFFAFSLHAVFLLRQNASLYQLTSLRPSSGAYLRIVQNQSLLPAQLQMVKKFLMLLLFLVFSKSL